jgi:hypothetical protein
MSADVLAREAITRTSAFQSSDPQALASLPLEPLDPENIENVELPQFGFFRDFSMNRAIKTSLEYDLAHAGMATGVADNRRPLTSDDLSGIWSAAYVVLSSDLIGAEGLWQKPGVVAFVLDNRGLRPVRLSTGPRPETDEVHTVVDDLVARLEHRAMRFNAREPLFAVAIPTTGALVDRAVRFVSGLDRSAQPGISTIEVRGRRISLQTIRLRPQQLRRDIVEGLLATYPDPVLASRTLSLPGFDALFEGSYEFSDAQGQSLQLPLLRPIGADTSGDVASGQQGAAEGGVCGVGDGPIVISVRPIDPGQPGIVVYPSVAPELAVAIGSSLLAMKQAIGQPFADMYTVLQVGMAEAIVLPGPDEAISLGFDRACSSFVFATLE